MKQPKIYNDFNAATVPLRGSNLIEASAGTGKTYSIAILVLRLVLEERIPIREILMVTFTKAAVAELQERIRLFVRSAWKAANGVPIGDDNILQLVSAAVKRTSEEDVRQCLRDAVLFLDETSVLTIHSFCQNTLNEFAFETSQLFGTDMLPDIKPLIEDELNKFWRRHVTTMPVALLSRICDEALRGSLTQAISDHLSGKRFAGFSAGSAYAFSSGDCDEWMQKLIPADAEVKALTEALHQWIRDNRADLAGRCGKNRYAQAAFSPFLDDPSAFLIAVRDKIDKGYVTKGFPDLLDLIAACDGKSAACAEILQEVITRLYCFAIQETERGVRQFKLRNNLLSYDDMIFNLHHAFAGGENTALISAMRAKYKAVFIDEFQDTDKQQFEIFDTAFREETILFYIGDPKQSIYAWRKADIFTYFRARDGVDALYSMNQNFRSSTALILAMNRFFLPREDFDTFHFGSSGNSIRYVPVESPSSNSKGACYRGGEADIPISVFTCRRTDELKEAVAAQVALLLHPDRYSLGLPGTTAAVRPSDIGILVRSGREGADIKASLARLGIPAVTINEAKVLQSEEALCLYYILTAMADPNRSTINRALLSPITGFNTAAILQLDDEAALGRFTAYRATWQRDGVYTAMMRFIADFSVKEQLLSRHTESGERMLTNVNQLTELLHQIQNRRSFSATEMLSWFKRGIDGMATEGDEYEQRVENDEEAVKIVTIHKSKGLEYKVVLAPFLDFKPHKQSERVSFRDPHTQDYVSVERKRLTPEQESWQAEQEEQENRRLLYVAITRAVYKCFIFRCTSKSASTLSYFTDALKDAEPHLLCMEETLPELPDSGVRIATGRTGIAPELSPARFALLHEGWRKLSYTGLAAKSGRGPLPRPQKADDAYDQFIFSELTRGRKTGDMLHYIFERISFQDSARHEAVISEALSRYAPARREAWLPMLQVLLEHTLHCPVRVEGSSFTLSDVARNRRIPEFEFDFPVSPFSTDAIQTLSDDAAGIRLRYSTEKGGQALEGIMNGKMDLFFEHGGRYYILDWKSNYLGDSMADYAPAALQAAMTEENYHLQYLIYTVAAKKYLQSRVSTFDYDRDFGGVIYLFLRGVRQAGNSGIYSCKPPAEKIARLESILRDGASTPEILVAAHAIELPQAVVLDAALLKGS